MKPKSPPQHQAKQLPSHSCTLEAPKKKISTRTSAGPCSIVPDVCNPKVIAPLRGRDTKLHRGHETNKSSCDHLQQPFLRWFRCRSGSQTLQKRQRLFPYCSLFSTFFVPATHFIASPRSPGIGRLPETVKHLAVSPCPLGLGLRSGLPVYFEEEIEAFVFLFLQRSSSSTASLRRSLRCTPAYWLDFLSYLTTDASNFQSAPDPSGGGGELAMVAPGCHP